MGSYGWEGEADTCLPHLVLPPLKAAATSIGEQQGAKATGQSVTTIAKQVKDPSTIDDNTAAFLPEAGRHSLVSSPVCSADGGGNDLRTFAPEQGRKPMRRDAQRRKFKPGTKGSTKLRK